MQETSLSDPTDLEQTLNFTIGIDADGFSGWFTWQARHRHNLAADDNNKAGTGTDPHLAHRHNMAGWRAALGGIRRKTILGFRHTNRQMSIAL